MTTEFEKKRERHASAESSKSVASYDSVSNYIPTPPDGGWGWMVVIASFVNHIIVDGLAFTFGVFYLEFLSYFKESKGKTALVGSLLCGIYLCTGPVSSALSNRFGCRPVCIAGGFIAAGGFLLSTFSTNINMLMVTYGVMGGFGLGLVYLPSIVSVSYYFEKKRAIATGIAVCGAGVGTFIFAPVGRLLLEMYDWKNAMIIVAGVTLNSIVCGLLMRPLEAPKKRKKPRKKNFIDRVKEKTIHRIKRDSESGTLASYNKETAIIQKVHEAKLARQQELCDDDDVSIASGLPSTRKESKISSIILSKFSISRQNSMDMRSASRQNSIATPSSGPCSPSGTLPRIVVNPGSEENLENKLKTEKAVHNEEEKMDLGLSSEKEKLLNESSSEKTEKVPKSKSGILVNGSSCQMNGSVPSEAKLASLNGDAKPIPLHANGIGKHAKSADISAINSTLLTPQEMVRPSHGSVGEIWLKMPRERKSKDRVRVLKEDYARPLYRKDIFYSGSIMHIPQFRSQPEVRTYLASITTIPRGDGDEGDFSSSNRWCQCLCLPKSARDTLREMLDLSLLKDPVFIINCISNIFGMIGLYVPFVYIVEKAMLSNIEPGRAAFLLSVIGTTNTIGRVVAGALANLPRVSPLLMHNVAIILGGAACLLVRFCSSYGSFCAFAAFFGLCVATWISLTSIILCEMLGLEKLTNAFGLLTLARGVASVAGPPLAGIVYDLTGTLDSSFDVGGVMLIIAGLLHCILHLPKFNRSRDRDDVNLDVYGEQVPHPDDIVLDSDEEDLRVDTQMAISPTVDFDVNEKEKTSDQKAAMV